MTNILDDETPSDSNGWPEYKKFVVAELTRNREMHDILFAELRAIKGSLEITVDRSTSRLDSDVKDLAKRVGLLEKLAENLRTRILLAGAGLGAIAAIISRIVAWMLEHVSHTP